MRYSKQGKCLHGEMGISNLIFLEAVKRAIVEWVGEVYMGCVKDIWAMVIQLGGQA